MQNIRNYFLLKAKTLSPTGRGQGEGKNRFFSPPLAEI